MKQFAVVGCGRFGKALAIKLSELDQEVLAIDKDEEVINELSSYVTHAVTANITVEGVLEELGIQNFDVVIVGMSANFEASVLVTTISKELGVPTVVVKVKDSFQGKIMTKVGADKVIIPEKESGYRLAHSLVKGGILDFIEVSDEYSMMEVKAPATWIDRKIIDLGIRQDDDLTIIAIRRDNEDIVNPSPQEIIEEKDILLVLGPTSHVEALVKITND
ncbi:TrkA family potassium uptake protein [Lagierella sp.]|uniref:potassium channel family protein n=1 Tax=Lagierella sp. TaxID=2849657 RepID=UPI002608E077|nr:TrkA family potassium uptake protein [Lagierella sp.]